MLSLFSAEGASKWKLRTRRRHREIGEELASGRIGACARPYAKSAILWFAKTRSSRRG